LSCGDEGVRHFVLRTKPGTKLEPNPEPNRYAKPFGWGQIALSSAVTGARRPPPWKSGLTSTVAAGAAVADSTGEVRVATGRVKFYDAKQGFGYLSQDDGPDVYVRKESLAAGVEALRSGTRVEFEVAEGPRGPQARSVQPVTSRPAGPPPAVRRSVAELDTLIAELIGLLDTTVLPELGKGRYPDQAPAKLAAQMARTLVQELDLAAAEQPEARRTSAPGQARGGRRAPTPPRS
jgi:CspA family cold shock protein